MKFSYLTGGLLGSLLVLSVASYGQLTIQGTVTDDRGEPLAGANVLVLGTQYGGATNPEGGYTILVTQVPDEVIVVARFLGYRTARQTVTQTSGIAEVNFQLAIDILQMDEVVVTGASVAVEKRQLGNAISTVDARQLSLTASTAIDRALSGKIAGALIQQNSGNPGGGVSVRLRGVNTVLGSAEPLYIVDGVIVSNESTQLIDLGGYNQNRIMDLNLNDVERIEIIKGAAAAAIYGSRANNGVVQIFTKKGQSGEPQVTFSTRFQVDELRKKLPINTFPFDKRFNDSTRVPVTRYDYQDFIFQGGAGTENYLSLTAGSGGTKYFFSGSHAISEGIIKGAWYERSTARGRIEQTLTPWLFASAGANYTFSRTKEIPNGGIFEAYGALTGFNFAKNSIDPRPVNGIYPSSSVIPRTNPVEAIDLFDFRQQVNRFVGDLHLTLTPVEGFGAEYVMGLDSYTQIGTAYIPPGTTAPSYTLGMARRGERNTFNMNNDITLRYDFSPFEDVKSTTVGGATLQFTKLEDFSAQSTDLTPTVRITPAGATQVVGEFRSEVVIYGIFAQETFAVANRLYITAAGRMDASSVFGEDNRWQFYPKASVSYILSEEGFWKESGLPEYISSLKLRASWGQSGGLTAVGPFDRFSTYSSVSYNNRPGLITSTRKGTPGIKPELQREIEFGTDMSFLEDRLGIEFTYYDKFTDDLLLNRTLGPTSGYLTQVQNVGTMTNKGFEVLIRAVPIQTGGFRWNSALTYSQNRNNVDGVEGGRVSFADGFGQVYAMNGQPLGIFYTTQYARNPDGTLLLTATGLPQREQVGRDPTTGQPTGGLLLGIVGDPNPDWTASWINDFEIENAWSVRMQWDAVWGFDVFNFTRRVGIHPNYGNLEGYGQELEGKYPAGYSLAMFPILGAFIEDGSFIKLRELSVSYSFQPGFFGIKGARVSVIGRNLLSIDDYSGWDPETNAAGQSTVTRGFDFNEVPIPRSYSFSLMLNL
ncbi:MAG TPA: TonB-dependent receptor [Bacteroidota bacterium]